LIEGLRGGNVMVEKNWRVILKFMGFYRLEERISYLLELIEFKGLEMWFTMFNSIVFYSFKKKHKIFDLNSIINK
jgi:hypothetical protein